MTTTDYLIDSVLVLLVLLQIRERTLTHQDPDSPAVDRWDCRDGLAVRVYLLDHPRRRRIDRRFQCPTRDYRERVDGRAARDGGVRSGRPLGVDGGSPSASARPPRFRVRLTPLPSLSVFTNLTGRTALTIRLVGLALVSWTVLTASHHPPGDSGRGWSSASCSWCAWWHGLRGSARQPPRRRAPCLTRAPIPR